MTLLVSMFVLGAGGALADSPVPRDARGFSAPVILDEADPWSYRTPPAEPIVPAPPRGRYAMDDQVRAGYPDTLSRWAVRSVTPAYSAGWVGGGTLLPGQPRYIHADGVWGFDYDGWLLNRRIWLGWSHGRRYQGGRGAYDSEGPPKASHFLHTRLEEARERRSGHKE
ncbi:MAG: hypothetical protein KY475_05550 [Planctomycetes bacterium]|nr:hypothetical protein [Planctomycetota bacterium]